MDLDSILSSLRRNPTGAFLIAIQAAITVAMVSNIVFFVWQQSARMSTSTGVDESNIVSLDNLWTIDSDDVKAKLQADLSALRSLPGVQDAYATEGLPLHGSGFTTSVGPRADDALHEVTAALYPVDEHGLQTLGLNLLSGRWFTANEIQELRADQSGPDNAPMVVLSQALARRLFPDGRAVGNTLYMQNKPSAVIGVVERMQAQTPWAFGANEALEYSLLSPYLWAANRSQYVLRALPGQRNQVLAAAQKKLLEISRNRVISDAQTFVDARQAAYRPVAALSSILQCVGVLLMIVTGLGILGLTSFWVARRQSQIGIRRALGARRSHILGYFLTENLLVAGTGAMFGAVFALIVNHVVVREFEMARITVWYVVSGVALVVCLSALSALWPALRASAVSPAIAARAA